MNTKNGKVTVKKKTKKGTYKATVKVSLGGNDSYAPEIKTVNVVIKVKK